MGNKDENERLVPICIIYIDDVRLSTALEGAFRSVTIHDRMNGIGECAITFYNQDLEQDDKKTFSYDSKVSVELGYKDNTSKVFIGEIIKKNIDLSEHGSGTFSVTASSYLQRLDHGIHKRVFTNKTPSQAVQDILSNYDLKTETDSFGVSKGHWEGDNISDFDLVLGLAKRYGKDICAFNNKVYVKDQMTHNKEEIIYEWGKSLISFDVKEDIREQASKIHVFGWNQREKKEFRTEVKAGDVEQKTGGSGDWTKVSKGGSGQWIDYHYCADADDSEEAKEIANALMREKSYKYLRAEGSAEGNCKLSAGATVTVKYVGTAFSGEYIAETVIHRFSLDEGYITDFHLKRNMVSDDYVKQVSGKSSVSSGGGGKGNSTEEHDSAIADDGSSSADEEEEDENSPEFRALAWKKDGREIKEALVDDEVTLFCEVKNIDDGEKINITINEYDDDLKHDEIKKLEGTVKDSKVEVPWKVEYHADDDDDPTNCALEIEEQGYTIPEYYFFAEYKGTESEDSKQLDIKGKIDVNIKSIFDKKLLINKKYTIYYRDGTKTSGKTDENGHITTDCCIGEKYILFHDKNEGE